VSSEYSDNVTLLILAGGEGRRMGGKDKPLVLWHDKPMVEWVANATPNLTTIISANRNLSTYARYGEVVTDQHVAEHVAEHLAEKVGDPQTSTSAGPKKPAHTDDAMLSGPLVGVLGGLLTASTQWLLVAAGDTPNLPMHWGEQLWEVAQRTTRTPCRAVVVHDGARQQHLHALLHKDLLTDLQDYLCRGRREVYKFWEDSGAQQCVVAPEKGDFRNVNSPADLQD